MFIMMNIANNKKSCAQWWWWKKTMMVIFMMMNYATDNKSRSCWWCWIMFMMMMLNHVHDDDVNHVHDDDVESCSWWWCWITFMMMIMTITASLPKTHSCEDVYSQFRAQLCWRCRPHWEPTKWSRPCRCDASSSPVPGTVSEARAAPGNTKPVTLKISSPLDTHLVTWYFMPNQVWRSHYGKQRQHLGTQNQWP